MTNHQTIIAEIIPAKLREIEQRENVRILHCVESGSRAWGFASPDSDYDVRFIYVRTAEDYLRLDKMRDVIEWQLDETLDISGWDLQKALRLLHSSNPTLFEWIASPLVYKTTPEWARISAVVSRFFQPKAMLCHYLHTARKNCRTCCEGDLVKLKRYFYALRPILACRWILENRTPPPMLFTELTDAFLDPTMAPAVRELLRLKMETPEVGMVPAVAALNDYLNASLEALEPMIHAFPRATPVSWEALNRLFLEALLPAG